jgi:protein involved in polysaccharide export with SLBB domain
VLAAATLPDEPENVQVEVFRQGRSLETLNAEDVLGGEDVWTGPLRPGDVVVVSRVSTVKVWISTGFALPGEAEIYRDATLGKAVALGGGIAYPEARNIEERLLMQEGTNFIIRRGDRTISVPVTEEGSSLDTPLEPGDTITVKFPKVAQVLVAGQVTLPGTQVMRPGASVLEAISKARGIEDEGSLREVFVFRDGTTRRLDLSQPELGRELERVEDGDLIYVGRNERYALVLGTVTVPGKVLFPDDREEFRVTDALAEARGLDRTGTLRRVVLLRTNEEGVYEAQEFNLDEYVKDGREEANPVLQPGDVVLFGKPRGLTLANASQILSSALLLENLLGD